MIHSLHPPSEDALRTAFAWTLFFALQKGLRRGRPKFVLRAYKRNSFEANFAQSLACTWRVLQSFVLLISYEWSRGVRVGNNRISTKWRRLKWLLKASVLAIDAEAPSWVATHAAWPATATKVWLFIYMHRVCINSSLKLAIDLRRTSV
jgi:hypothetical protein